MQAWPLPFHPKGAAVISLGMTEGRQDKAKTASGTKTRRERLEEALRANLARRKAQKKARRETAITQGNDQRKPDGDGEQA